MANHIYVGITIGPIYATLMRTSTPAGMWFVSTMFSKVSEELCKELVRNGLERENIFSPYFSKKMFSIPDGIGLYHDRILFFTDSDFIPKIPECIMAVKQRIASYFDISLNENRIETNVENSTEFIKEYLQIRYVYYQEEKFSPDVIFKLNHTLDVMELQEGYVYQTSDEPLVKILEGEHEAGGNQKIKKSFLMTKDPAKPFKLKDNSIQAQILKKDKFEIRNVKEIADLHGMYEKSEEKCQKHFHYWALVKADGDNMGKMLEKLTSIEEITEFSYKCLQYGSEAAELIGEEDGVTLYAGGDDLLFFAPAKDILSLCEDINGIYHRIFDGFPQGEDKLTTLSIGVQICYYRYPLYEALAQVSDLLNKAKAKGKNRIAVSLQKAFGREIAFTLKYSEANDNQPDIMKLLIDFLPKDNIDEYKVWLQSVLHTVIQYKSLFKEALNHGVDMNIVFKNIFHHDVHQLEPSQKFLGKIVALFQAIHEEHKKEKNNNSTECVLERYESLLRYIRFYMEKGEEK